MSHEGSREGETAYFSHSFKHESGATLQVHASLERGTQKKRGTCFVGINDGKQCMQLTGHVAMHFAHALSEISEINPVIQSPRVYKMSGEIGVVLMPDYEEGAMAVILSPRSDGLSQAFIISSKAQFHGCIDRITEMSAPDRKERHMEVVNSLLPVNSSLPEKIIVGPVADLLWSAYEHSQLQYLKDLEDYSLQ